MSLTEDSFAHMHRIHDAIEGDNPDQRRIAIVGLEWVDTLLRKNADYGSSVWKTPILTPGLDLGVAIRVRASDKISRIASLLGGNADKPQVASETVDDTFADLGAYCLLYLARPKQ